MSTAILRCLTLAESTSNGAFQGGKGCERGGFLEIITTASRGLARMPRGLVRCHGLAQSRLTLAAS
jgi:hypothetical protein